MIEIKSARELDSVKNKELIECDICPLDDIMGCECVNYCAVMTEFRNKIREQAYNEAAVDLQKITERVKALNERIRKVLENDFDTILCTDNEDAKNVIDPIGGEHIKNWEYLPGGEVRLILNCRLEDIADK